MTRVAVVGAAPSFIDAPFYNPDWEIWASGSRYCEHLTRLDRFFEVHGPDSEDLGFLHYRRFLDETTAELWVFSPEIRPVHTIYPRGAIESRFGRDFLTSSVAWMMALAIHEQVEEIGLWGVEMATESEYKKQRIGCKHFMKLAEELGIKVTVPPDCPLLIEAPSYPDT